jgi:integrase
LRVSTSLQIGRNPGDLKKQLVRRRSGDWVVVRSKRNRLIEKPISREIAATLRGLEPPLFPWARFKVYATLRRAAEASIGRSLSPHDLRRMHISLFYEASGRDLVLTSRIVANHANVATTMRYVLTDEKRARDILKSL